MLPSNENDDWETENITKMHSILRAIRMAEKIRSVVSLDIPCSDKSVKGNN
jgi:hypothetical protein